MRPAEYVTYFELFDRHPLIEELEEVLGRLNSDETIIVCCRLNTMFRLSAAEDSVVMNEFQGWFVTNFFDIETNARFLRKFGNANPSRRPVCHSLQLLNIIRLAANKARSRAATTDSEESVRRQHDLGTACLMISDLFCSDEERVDIHSGEMSQRIRHLIVQLLPSLEVSNPTPFRNLFARSFYLYSIALRDPAVVQQIRNECNLLDFEQRFDELIGIPLNAWRGLIAGIYTVLIKHSLKDFRNRQDIFLVDRTTIIKGGKLSLEQISKFFDSLSMTFSQLRSEFELERDVDDRFDVVPFMRRPFLSLSPDVYMTFDLALFLEKLNNGPYFLLADSLSPDERKSVFDAWGILFEHYVNWLLESVNGKHGASLYTDTRWEDNNNKSFDAVFVKARLVVTIESKSGFLKQSARYSSDVDEFQKELEKKMGKGCKQLAKGISKLFPSSGERAGLHGVPIPRLVEWVLPILVVQDLALRTPMINKSLNDLFQSEQKNFASDSRIKVLPLNVVQVTDLESLVQIADSSNLSVLGLLLKRALQNPSMSKELNSIIAELPESQRSPSSARFNQLFQNCLDDLTSSLFADESTETPKE